MSDSEILDLIQHYKWSVIPLGRDWIVGRGDIFGQAATLREAVALCLEAQAQFALAPQS